ncbi:MAG TPA: hypothetical protein VLT91_01870 [Rhizomicrobium sp.]|nr:hypothetical protein [Rhizomicrobium sp.]
MIEQRIKDQFPTVFITLVSVLVGLALSDLVAEARAHMTLWPLNMATARTWAQIFANSASAVAVWIVFAHVGIARRRVPDIFDSLIAFGPPLLLLIANSFVGQREIWPWFYNASVYLAVCAATSYLHTRMALHEPELTSLRGLLRMGGHIGLLLMGVVIFGVAGYCDRQGYLSPFAEVLIAASPVPAAALVTYLFMRDWRAGVLEA